MSGVLDSYALIAVAQRQPGAETVRAAIEAGGTRMSWINLGEVFYILTRRFGEERARRIVEDTQLDTYVEAPDGRLTLAAARLKVRGRIAYADCFAVATAMRDRLPLLTGDPEILALHGPGLDVVDLRDAA